MIGLSRRPNLAPDFYLNDLGVIVEYVGMPDDEEYMKGIHKKEIVYEEMGVDVIWIYPEDIWDESNGKYWQKENASAIVLNKVYDALRSGSVKADLYGSKSRDFGNRSGLRNRYTVANWGYTLKAIELILSFEAQIPYRS